jgi:hypothetical protein
MSGGFQVFVSYARKDNESPKGDPSLKGFVTFLHESLNEELTDLGATAVNIWRDTRNISDVDQFTPVLEEQVGSSSIMLVIMSPNWLASSYCQAEVKLFTQRWSDEGEEALKNRVKVVRKRPNDRNLWPSFLQGQVGIPFYSEDQSDGVALEDGYFWRGKVRDETYHQKVRELAGILSREASRVYTQIPKIFTHPVRVSVQRKTDARRTIFVAKPATDMQVPYNRVVHELTRRGYSVVPEQDIPLDESAITFIDSALERADLSVHLLGVKGGYTPQDVSPIVQLQLERAATREMEGAPRQSAQTTLAEFNVTEHGVTKYHFHRIVWAPRILEASVALQPMTERDPLVVLSDFAEKLPSDKIDGQGLSKFVDFLVQTVAVDDIRILPPPLSPGAAPKVYLYHEKEDIDFAMDLATALKARNVEPLTPITTGPPQDVRAQHRRRLAECDAVALCWASTPEIKLSAKTNELKNWRQLKRGKPFAYRGLVVGPPPNEDKKNSRFHFSMDEIDLQLDLSQPNGELAELVDRLVPRASLDGP